MAATDSRACAGDARYGTLRRDGLKPTELDCVYYADMAHLYTCRCSDCIRLEGGFGLIPLLILLDSGE